MALAFGLFEGTAIDWSALHVTTVAEVDSTTGSLVLLAVCALMVAIDPAGWGPACRAIRPERGSSLRRNLPRRRLSDGEPGEQAAAPDRRLGIGWIRVGMIAPQVYAVAGHIGGGQVLA